MHQRVLVCKGFSESRSSMLTEVKALGAMSKAMATVISQPLIVAKVGLQSKPPASRQGRPFKTFGEVMAHIIEHEGLMRLFKGLAPQLSKALLVQGLPHAI